MNVHHYNGGRIGRFLLTDTRYLGDAIQDRSGSECADMCRQELQNRLKLAGKKMEQAKSFHRNLINSCRQSRASGHRNGAFLLELSRTARRQYELAAMLSVAAKTALGVGV